MTSPLPFAPFLSILSLRIVLTRPRILFLPRSSCSSSIEASRRRLQLQRGITRAPGCALAHHLATKSASSSCTPRYDADVPVPFILLGTRHAVHVAATLWLIGATPEAGPQTLESEPSDLDPATVFNRFTEMVRADLDRKIQLKSDGSYVDTQRIGTSQSATPG